MARKVWGNKNFLLGVLGVGVLVLAFWVAQTAPTAEACEMECDKQVGGNCTYQPDIFGFTSWACVVNGSLGVGGSEDSNCSDGASNTACRLDFCPNFNDADGATCETLDSTVSGLGCGVNTHDTGKWDANESKCIECSTSEEDKIYGDTSGIYAGGIVGDDECESACGANASCDEKTPGELFGACFKCEASATNNRCQEACTSLCDYKAAVCSTGCGVPLASGCAGFAVGDSCGTGKTCDENCDCVGGTTTYTLTVSKIGSGTVTSSDLWINCGATCSHIYNSGALVTLTAAAAINYTFSGWSGGGCSGAGTCTVTMDADKSVTATFALSGGDWIRYSVGGVYWVRHCPTEVDNLSSSYNNTSGGSCVAPSKWQNCGDGSPSTFPAVYDCFVGFDADCTNPKRCSEAGYAADCDCVAAAGCTGDITGTVSDAATNAAISGATVSVSATYGGKSDITDAAGNYTLTGVSYTTCSVMADASAAGYITKSDGITLNNGGTVTHDFKLTSGAGAPACSNLSCGAANAILPCMCGTATANAANLWCCSGNNNVYVNQAACQIGACAAGCPACANGIMDCGETGIDCGGGGCPACAAAVPPSRCDPNAWAYCNPLEAISTISQAAEEFLGYVLGLVGSVALLFIIIAGLMYMTSAGSEERIATSKRILTGAVIGLGIALLAYSLLQVIITVLNM